MPRVKNSVKPRKGRKKIIKLAKGYFGAKSVSFRVANQQVMKSLAYAYRDRKLRKRDFRKLWIVRINAAARNNGLSYSKFMGGLKKAGVEINRKMLAELAVKEPNTFKKLVEVAQEHK